MNFNWRDYDPQTDLFVESWLDSDGAYFTGCDEGWRSFYEYWLNEPDFNLGEDYWCKIAYSGDAPCGIIALSKYQGKVTVMEILVSPELRGKGIGTKMLAEMLEYSVKIIGKTIKLAEAVVFPDNTASRKMFEYNGFTLDRISEEGDAMYYRYTAPTSPSICTE